jgi:hypothetical protein
MKEAKKHTYLVNIYQEPYSIVVKAKDKAEAEDQAVYAYNGGQHSDIDKITSKKVGDKEE